MNRILPYPLLWLALVAMWLALTGSLAPGQILLGAIIVFSSGSVLAPLMYPFM